MPDPYVDPGEIDALIRLLDDPDETVQEAVRNRLHTLGRHALPSLRQAEEHADASLRTLLADVAHELHFADIECAWQAVMTAERADLERGAFLLALYRFPELDIPAYQAHLDELARIARSRLQAASGIERIFILNDFVFHELGFGGERQAAYDPNNSCINWVLDHRSGIPISLSVLYLLLSERLGLPVCGINMPTHFLMKYDDGRNEVFMDAFNGGKPFLKEEALRSLLAIGIKPRRAYFRAATPHEILLRLLRTMVTIAQENNQDEMLDDLVRLMQPWDVSVG